MAHWVAELHGLVDKMIVPLGACHYALMSLSKGPNDVVKGL